MYGKKNSELYEQLKRGLLGVGMKQHQATSQDMSGHRNQSSNIKPNVRREQTKLSTTRIVSLENKNTISFH